MKTFVKASLFCCVFVFLPVMAAAGNGGHRLPPDSEGICRNPRVNRTRNVDPRLLDPMVNMFQGYHYLTLGIRGQGSGDAVQIHSEGYMQGFNPDPIANNDLAYGQIVRGGIDKTLRIDPESVTASQYDILSPPSSECVPYEKIKSWDQSGAEYFCAAPGRSPLLLYESGALVPVPNKTDFRTWDHPAGNNSWARGSVWLPAKLDPSGATFTPFREQGLYCSQSKPKPPTFWQTTVTTLGPMDITSPVQQAAAAIYLRQMGDAPPPVPDMPDDAIAPGWSNIPSFFLMPGGRMYLTVREDWEGLSCACRLDCAQQLGRYNSIKETYWYIVVTGSNPDLVASAGEVRWNIQQNGVFFRQGTQDTFVTETGSAIIAPKMFCSATGR